MAHTVKHDVPVTTASSEAAKPASSALRQPYEAFEHFMEKMLSRGWWQRPRLWSDPFGDLMMPFQSRRPRLLEVTVAKSRESTRRTMEVK